MCDEDLKGIDNWFAIVVDAKDGEGVEDAITRFGACTRLRRRRAPSPLD